MNGIFKEFGFYFCAWTLFYVAIGITGSTFKLTLGGGVALGIWAAAMVHIYPLLEEK